MTDLKDLYEKYVERFALHRRKNCDYIASFTKRKKWADNIEDKNDLIGWRQRYEDTHNWVLEVRRLLENNYKLKTEKDQAFLERLIKESGYISNSGKSFFLPPDNFEKLISERVFLKALEALIKDPNANNFVAFGVAWRQCKKDGSNNNPLRVNRVAAACTLEVSSTVSVQKFKEVFKKLENYIEPYIEPDLDYESKNEKQDFLWFDKNQHIIRELRKKFQTELANGNTDSFWLSIFVWELCRPKNK